MIKEIKKGDRFVCVNANVAELGDVYVADIDGSFATGNYTRYNLFPDKTESVDFMNRDFIPFNYKSIQKHISELPMTSLDDVKIANIFHLLLGKVLDESVTDDFEENNLAWSIGSLPPYYDNTHGSLYQIASNRGWNAYQFDIIKRIDRALKKGCFKQDLEKTKALIDLWLGEVDG